jgi:hypothetical protein
MFISGWRGDLNGGVTPRNNIFSAIKKSTNLRDLIDIPNSDTPNIGITM